MKKIIFCALAFFQLNNIVHAQTDNTDLDIVQSMFGKSKRMIISSCIQLNGQEQKQFWRLYDQYEEKRKSLEKDRFLLLKQFADNYETLDSHEAGILAMGFMKNTGKTNKLHKIYFKKVEKAIGGLKAATFFQVETYLQTALQSNIQSQVPVIGELEIPKNKTGEIDPAVLNNN